MILLFGQHPHRSLVDRQMVIQSRVGSIGDKIASNGGGGGGGRPSSYVRREKITDTPPDLEEDLVIAIAAFMILETDRQS
jgi:hypothetical protein